PELRANAGGQRDGVLRASARSPATEHFAGGIAERANQRDFFDGFGNRQRVVFVFQKHAALGGGFARERDGVGPQVGVLVTRLVRVRLVEEALEKFYAQDAPHGPVDDGLRNFSI